MFRHFLAVSLRSLARNRLFTALNLVGMAAGIACCLLIGLYIQQELSFDDFHPNGDRIYRIGMSGRFGDQDIETSEIALATGQDLRHDYSEVEAYTRFSHNGNTILAIPGQDKVLTMPDFYYADSNFFQFFGYKLLRGNPATVLREPNSLVLTEEAATRLFGTEDPIGKVVRFDNQRDMKVTGIAANPPANSHLHFYGLTPFTAEQLGNIQYGWLGNMNHYTFLRMRPGVDAAGFMPRIQGQVVEKYVGPLIQKFLGVPYTELVKKGQGFNYYLEPIASIHLEGKTSRAIGRDGASSGDRTYVNVFFLVGAFILLIACVNFINLATARAADRAKEVGIRKVLGSDRRQLMWQFLAESALLTVGGVLLALVLATVALPFVSQLAGRELSPALLLQPMVLLGLLVGALVMGFVAGIYPSLYLSSFLPVKVIKGGSQSTGRRGSLLRSGLVVFQFALGTVMIIATLVVYDQLEYVRTQNLGFNREGLLVVNDTWVLRGQQAQTFKQEALRIPGVKAAALTGLMPGMETRNNSGMAPVGRPDITRILAGGHSDGDLVRTLGLQLLYGRDLDNTRLSDSFSVILNEAAVQQFGWKPEEAVGKQIAQPASPDGPPADRFTVVGVVKNFHYQGMQNLIGPVGIYLDQQKAYMAIRIDVAQAPEVIAALTALWKKHSANAAPFSYQFVSERLAEQYLGEVRLGRIFSLFSVLAVLIAALGLFGLATYMAAKRQKEVGVRKVLGASEWQIFGLFARDFALLVVVAFVIACPVAWYFMQQWLEGYKYRIELNPATFLLAGGLAVFITLLTISYQSIRAAVSNPVKSLRSE